MAPSSDPTATGNLYPSFRSVRDDDTRAIEPGRESSPGDPFAGMPTPSPLTPSKISKPRQKIRKAWRQVSGSFRSNKSSQKSNAALQDMFVTPEQQNKRKSSNSMPSQAINNQKRSRFSQESADGKLLTKEVSKLSLIVASLDSGQTSVRAVNGDDATLYNARSRCNMPESLSPFRTPSRYRPITQAIDSSIYGEPDEIPDVETDPIPECCNNEFDPASDPFAGYSCLGVDDTNIKTGSVTILSTAEDMSEPDSSNDQNFRKDYYDSIDTKLISQLKKSLIFSEVKRLELRMDRELGQLRSDVFLELGRIKESRSRLHQQKVEMEKQKTENRDTHKWKQLGNDEF